MMSRKWIVGLMAIMLITALAPSSFAQIEIRLFNTPTVAENALDRHARTADLDSAGAGLLVSGVLIANSTLTTTTLTLTFPARITSNGAYPSATEGLRIEGMSGVFANVSGFTTAGTTGNQLAIILPGFLLPGGANYTNVDSGSFRIVGLRLDGAALSGTNIGVTSAALSSSSNNYIPPSGTLPSLITALSTSLGAITATSPANTATIFTNQVGAALAAPADVTAAFTIAEGFANAWRTASQNSVNLSAAPTGVSGNGLRFTLTGLPAGVTATITPTAGGTAFLEAAVVITNAGAAAATVVGGNFTFTGTNPGAIESETFTVTFSGTPTALVAGAIGVTATMATSTTASTAATISAGTFPKYNVADTNNLTIANVVIAKTTMLLPYAVKIGANGATFNTGIAIANTTGDPASFGTGAATNTDGAITFYLYPRTSTGAGTAVSVTSSAANATAIGEGLGADGRLVAGGTYTAALSSILGAAGVSASTDFIGYLFVETDFLNAHGLAYIIANGTTISSGLPVMVLPPPVATTRNTITVESLGN